MARIFYCAECGTELVLKRKALRNKGLILDIIETHDCDLSNIENIKDADKPVPRQAFINPDYHQEEDVRTINPSFGDRRKAQKKIKSTAPSGILNILGDKRQVDEEADEPESDEE